MHCPPGTHHTFVGAGEGACLPLMIGARVTRAVRSTRAPAALRHGAVAELQTDSPSEAYAPFGSWRNDGPPNPAGL